MNREGDDGAKSRSGEPLIVVIAARLFAAVWSHVRWLALLLVVCVAAPVQGAGVAAEGSTGEETGVPFWVHLLILGGVLACVGFVIWRAGQRKIRRQRAAGYDPDAREDAHVNDPFAGKRGSSLKVGGGIGGGIGDGGFGGPSRGH